VTSHENLTTGEWMVLTVIEQRKYESGSDAPIPSIEEIDNAIDGSDQATSLGEFIGAAWDDAKSIVYDKFPQFREANEEDEDGG